MLGHNLRRYGHFNSKLELFQLLQNVRPKYLNWKCRQFFFAFRILKLFTFQPTKIIGYKRGRLFLPFFGLGFKSQAQHIRLFQFWYEKNKIERKEAGIDQYLKQKIVET